ncbi:MAG: clostripain-related cysteine peptidase [Chloroflexaceae bacterium]
MKHLLLLTLVLCVALTTGLPRSRAQEGPTLFAPDLPAPLPPAFHLDTAERLSPAQISLRCTQALADPRVDVAPTSSPWRVFREGWTFVTDVAYSPPRALYFGAAGDATPPDASVGQEIAIPVRLTELEGNLRYRYASGTTGPGDGLQVELYEVNRINPAGLIARVELNTAGDGDGAWRLFEWEVTAPAAIERLRSLGRAALLVTALNPPNGATPRLWLDDINARVCEPAASLGGQVRLLGTPASGANVLLTRNNAAGATIVASATSGIDGGYRFGSVAPLPPETRYQVWFRPGLETPTLERERMGLWAGPQLAALADGDTATLPPFDVASVQLEAPDPFAVVVATDAQPATFTWRSERPGANERHQFCLYDPQQADPATRLPAQLCGPLLVPGRDSLRFNLGPRSFASAPGFPFTYGREYRWYVVVYDRDPQADANYQYGFSHFERAVQLLPTPLPEPPTPPALPPGDPAAGAPGALWTLLIYVAADNALSDAQRAPRSARPATQLARLPVLATAHPGLRIVSLVDEYGPGGLRLCFYAPTGAPDCRLRPEANSADPATLADFIRFGRERYPATRTALMIVAPAQASGWLALDETSAGAILSLDGLRAAYAAAGLGASQPLDLLIYQAPYMGTLDALRASAPYARFAVGSAGPMWQLGPYERLLPALSGVSDPATAAAGAVAAYSATADASRAGLALSLAAYDLSRIEETGRRVDTLADALRGALVTDRDPTRSLVTTARAAAQVYDASGNGRHDQLITPGGQVIPVEEDALVDVRDLALRLRDSTGIDASVQAAASQIVALLDTRETSPLIAATQRSGLGSSGAPVSLERATGLAILFPSGDRLGGQPALAAGYLYGEQGNAPNTNPWARMLRTYLRETLGAGPGGITEGPPDAPRFQPLIGATVPTDIWLPWVGR